MAYCTDADVQSVLVTPAVSGPKAVASGVIDDAISEASDEVNSAIEGRYTVPFPDSAVPDQIKRITRDIAAYLVMLVYLQGQQLAATDPAQLRYNRAEQLLGKLASGQMQLPATLEGDGTDAAAEVSASGAAVVNAYSGALFTPVTAGIVPDLRGGWQQVGYPTGMNDDGF